MTTATGAGQPDGPAPAEVNHHPMLAATGRHGCWAVCLCGQWQGRLWTTVTGAHLEFGQHLLAAARR